jgi:hypothetical protein
MKSDVFHPVLLPLLLFGRYCTTAECSSAISPAGRNLQLSIQWSYKLRLLHSQKKMDIFNGHPVQNA